MEANMENMDNVLLIIIGVVLIGLFLSLPVGYVLWMGKKLQAWKNFAKNTGLPFANNVGLWNISGLYKGFKFDLRLEKRPIPFHQPNVCTYTVIELFLKRENKYQFEIDAKIIGYENDFKTGDEKFDEVLTIISNNSEVNNILTSELKSYLLNGSHLIKLPISIGKDKIHYEIAAIIGKPEELKFLSDTLCYMGTILENANSY